MKHFTHKFCINVHSVPVLATIPVHNFTLDYELSASKTGSRSTHESDYIKIKFVTLIHTNIIYILFNFYSIVQAKKVNSFIFVVKACTHVSLCCYVCSDLAQAG